MKLQKEKGITLVALVVTIVVLLILAGVSINLVLGENGLITQAQEAKRRTVEAQENEEKGINAISNYVENKTKELPTTKTTIPYYPSDEFKMLEGTNLDNGLVIEDASGNQYVWVEVPMTTDVYKTTGLNITEFNEETYTKIESDLHDYTATYRNGTSLKDEYCEEKNNSSDWFENENKYNEVKRKMLKSVYQNGGFWIARYEAGIENNRTSSSDEIVVAPQSKINLYPYTFVTRTQAKKLAEMVQYTKNETTYQGSLMFGVQWDLMLKFIETKKLATDSTIISKLNSNSKDIGNYKDATYTINRGKYAKFGAISTWYDYRENFTGIISNCLKTAQEADENGILLTTGASEQNCIMNIYDIAGNVTEWTLEYTLNENKPCVARGGYYYDKGNGFTAALRYGDNIWASYNCDGFRIAIF